MKLKVQFVQREELYSETTFEYKLWYYTEVDGKYVSGSGSFIKEKAYGYYLKHIKMLTNPQPNEILTVLEEQEVEVAVPF